MTIGRRDSDREIWQASPPVAGTKQNGSSGSCVLPGALGDAEAVKKCPDRAKCLLWQGRKRGFWATESIFSQPLRPHTPEICRFAPIAWCVQEGDAPSWRRRHAIGLLQRSGCFSAEPYPPQRQGPEYRCFVSWASDHDMPRSGAPGAIPDCWTQPYDVVTGLSCHAIGAKRKISSARPLRACRDHGTVRKPDEPTKSCAPGN